jgi:hypothetical protein
MLVRMLRAAGSQLPWIASFQWLLLGWLEAGRGFFRMLPRRPGVLRSGRPMAALMAASSASSPGANCAAPPPATCAPLVLLQPELQVEPGSSAPCGALAAAAPCVPLC